MRPSLRTGHPLAVVFSLFLPVFLALLITLLAGAARAQETPAVSASRHFQRAVELYNDGDFRGALVEFKKAYTLLPRAAVLYDIGQTEFQLQEYAPALKTLERFLAETGPNAAHRAEVQETVQILRGRVGRIVVSSDRNGCDVSVDDQPAGLTPLAEPLLVSIGRRRVAVACTGWQRATRDVDVSAGETVPVELKLGPSPSAAGTTTTAVAAVVDPSADQGRRVGRRTLVVAWTGTAVLVGATVGVYTAAVLQARKLDDLRATYPISAADFDDRRRLASRLALAGDILAVTTAVAAGLSTYLTFSAHDERGAVQVGFVPTPAGGGVVVHRTF